MSSIDQMLAALIDREGGFTDNPADKGGPTAFGITQATARKYGYTGDMRSLPRDFAEKVYRTIYFVEPGFDKIHALSQRIAEELFDTGVNMGPSIPIPWLQRWLNAFNQQGKQYADIAVDGQIGPATVGALRSFLNARGADGERVMANALNCLQGARYLDITESRPANEAFCYGWMLNRVALA